MTMKSDMEFYFNNNIGMKSNLFSTLLGSSHISFHQFQGQATFNENYSDNDFKQIRKYGKIANKYHQLSILHRRMLDALFNFEYVFPGEIRLAWGKRSGLALFTSQTNDIKELIKFSKNKLRVSQIQEEIDLMYQLLEDQWK